MKKSMNITVSAMIIMTLSGCAGGSCLTRDMGSFI